MPMASDAGTLITPAESAVPLSVTPGTEMVLVVTPSVAVAAPTTEGLKVTLIVQVPLAAMVEVDVQVEPVAGAVKAAEFAPVSVMPVSVTEAAELLVRVAVMAALVVPMT